MTRRHCHCSRIPTLALLGLALAWVTTARAQDNGEERWYRVELLVFSQPDSAAGQAEQWPATPDLRYPEQYRFLVDPRRVAANLGEQLAESTVDEFGVQTITLLPEPDLDETPPDHDTDIPPPGPASDIPRLEPDSDPTAGDQATAPMAQPGAEELPDPEAPPPRPTPFITLPDEEREFRGKAAYMERRGGYQLHFHQAWLQPMSPREAAVPLVLDRSGDSAEWPELQGSVLLYLSRYLHLETRLWLNTAGDYLPGQWRMPPAPLGPPSLVVIEPPPPETGDSWWYMDEAEIAAPEPESGSVPEEETAPEEPQYPWRHAVAMTEKRRMRSGEIHYLDHPLFGLLIKLTPVTEEELELRGLAEQASAAAAEAAAAEEAGSPADQPL